MKTLERKEDHEEIIRRTKALLPADRAQWGRMSAHQAICHLADSYAIALGQRVASSRSGLFQRTIMKWGGLWLPIPWPKNIKSLPEVAQDAGGTPPGDFENDRLRLLAVSSDFCAQLPQPCPPHPIFGAMSPGEWRRWGYLHADHHLRQFNR